MKLLEDIMGDGGMQNQLFGVKTPVGPQDDGVFACFISFYNLLVQQICTNVKCY